LLTVIVTEHTVIDRCLFHYFSLLIRCLLDVVVLVMCSYHNSLRRLLTSTRRSLTGLVRVLLSLADVQSEEISQWQLDALLTRTNRQRIGNMVEPYMAAFSPYSCGLIVDEISRVTNEPSSVTPVCIALQLKPSNSLEIFS